MAESSGGLQPPGFFPHPQALHLFILPGLTFQGPRRKTLPWQASQNGTYTE